jgi:phosphoglycerol transferase MdoB-like AlkP superfamily enzyme
MEDSTSPKQNSLSRFAEASVEFAKLSIVWLLIILLVSLFEVIYNGIHHHLSSGFIIVLFWSWLNDLLFWLKALLLLYIVFVILFLISRKFSERIYGVFVIIMVLIQVALTFYFATALVPLGADVPSHSVEIKTTLVGSIASFLSIFSLLLLLCITAAALWILPQKFHVNRYIAVLLPILSLFVIFAGGTAMASGVDLKSEFANNLVLNKIDYFEGSTYARNHPLPHELDIYADNYIVDYSNTAPAKPISFNYVDPTNYPFLHTDTEVDVLTPLFNRTAAPPNIVIIVVEGLGRAFTDDGAYLGNFTPFIDSLSDRSLYWKNFLSEGGETSAALPSILGSLPFSKDGFSALGSNMPEHLSLLNLLKYNGYHTSFYYGGNSANNNMNVFLRKNRIDELNDEKTFPKSGYTRMPAPNGLTTRGYDDKSLFNHFLATRNEKDATPQLSVLLTASSHSPFVINEEDKYLKKFEQRLTQLNFNENQKDAHRAYKAQYASILYLDDALGSFFNSYRKRSDYKNTIFLITGSCRMPDIPMSDKLDRYHVPLIVYSPMLKQPLTISSVSTHFDIAPSLFAYLHGSYKTKGPSLVSWIGQGLDTNHNYRNLHSYPLMQEKSAIVDFIMGDYHLNQQNLFKINGEFGEDLVQDDAKLNQIKGTFNQFLQRNSAIGRGNHIVPDSIIQRYSPAKR